MAHFTSAGQRIPAFQNRDRDGASRTHPLPPRRSCPEAGADEGTQLISGGRHRRHGLRHHHHGRRHGNRRQLRRHGTRHRIHHSHDRIHRNRDHHSSRDHIRPNRPNIRHRSPHHRRDSHSRNRKGKHTDNSPGHKRRDTGSCTHKARRSRYRTARPRQLWARRQTSSFLR